MHRYVEHEELKEMVEKLEEITHVKTTVIEQRLSSPSVCSAV